MQPHAQVSIFGDVVRIPRTQLAEQTCREVIRAAAQRNRESEIDQPRKKEVEPRCVLQREPTGDDVLMWVVVVELGLHATDLRPASPEDRKCLLELIRFWDILSVVDNTEFTTGELE